jgi:serine O-acetyltransferase
MSIDNNVWQHLRREVLKAAEHEPFLASYYHAAVFNHVRLETALSYHMASKLSNAFMSAISLHKIISDGFTAIPSICCDIQADLHAIRERDPAARGYARHFCTLKAFKPLKLIG